jgi:uncharacterized protein
MSRIDLDADHADDRPCNPSANPHLVEVMSRRALLKGMAAAVAVGGAGAPIFAFKEALASSASTLTFKEIAHHMSETHAVAPGYGVQVVIRWGDKVAKDAPPFDPGNITAEAQAKQFGFNNDFLAFMPLPLGSQSSDNGLLFVNHENIHHQLIWPGIVDDKSRMEKQTRQQIDAEMAMHGLSVIEVKKEGGRWNVVDGSRYNRRIHTSTGFRITGPAAGHARMKTSADPAGTLAYGTLHNCAGGVTPWGTCLSGEENYNNYFGGDSQKTAEAKNHKRQQVGGARRNVWFRFHDRFDVEKEPNEPNRFGWVVELDPYDPEAAPIKRTALGRIKHEGAYTVVSRDGRVVVYTGDDAYDEYVYRYVSDGRFDPSNRAANRELLDKGTLSVAKFEADGTMRWMPLVHGQGKLTAENGFRDQGDVLIDTRLAADAVGATKMDRPEDIDVSPLTGRVYVALTKHPNRKPETVDGPNPRPNNIWGHVLEMIPPGEGKDADHTADVFKWEVFLAGGDPKKPEQKAKYGAGVEHGFFACPDNFAFDPKGRLWIVTDGQDDAFGVCDSAYACDTTGPGRGVTKLFFNAPRGAEICGPAFTPDGKTLFLAIQHPAEERGSTVDKPSTRWPDFQANMPPRPSIVAVTKTDGGEIGS